MNDRQPNLFVVGVVKGGTTSLHHYLNQHPDVFLTPIKETHFFAFEDLIPSKFSKEYAMDVDLDLNAYLSQTQRPMVHTALVTDWEHYSKLYEGAEDYKIKGEVCPSYAICPSAAERIYRHSPEGHIIFLLRNPVARAWSQYLMNLREGKTMEGDFLTEVFEDDNRKEKGWGINHQYLSLGLYYEQVKRYIDLFGTEKVHVLLFEEFMSDPQKGLNQLLKKIGLPSIKVDVNNQRNRAMLPRSMKINRLLVRLGIINFTKKLFDRDTRQTLANLLYKRSHIPALSSEQSLRLRAYYAEDIAKLSKLIQRDLSTTWNLG